MCKGQHYSFWYQSIPHAQLPIGWLSIVTFALASGMERTDRRTQHGSKARPNALLRMNIIICVRFQKFADKDSPIAII